MITPYDKGCGQYARCDDCIYAHDCGAEHHEKKILCQSCKDKREGWIQGYTYLENELKYCRAMSISILERCDKVLNSDKGAQKDGKLKSALSVTEGETLEHVKSSRGRSPEKITGSVSANPSCSVQSNFKCKNCKKDILKVFGRWYHLFNKRWRCNYSISRNLIAEPLEIKQ